jgi:hypothetical protein
VVGGKKGEGDGMIISTESGEFRLDRTRTIRTYLTGVSSTGAILPLPQCPGLVKSKIVLSSPTDLSRKISVDWVWNEVVPLSIMFKSSCSYAGKVVELIIFECTLIADEEHIRISGLNDFGSISFRGACTQVNPESIGGNEINFIPMPSLVSIIGPAIKKRPNGKSRLIW